MRRAEWQRDWDGVDHFVAPQRSKVAHPARSPPTSPHTLHFLLHFPRHTFSPPVQDSVGKKEPGSHALLRASKIKEDHFIATPASSIASDGSRSISAAAGGTALEHRGAAPEPRNKQAPPGSERSPRVSSRSLAREPRGPVCSAVCRRRRDYPVLTVSALSETLGEGRLSLPLQIVLIPGD